MELKAIMAYLLMNYDIKFDGDSLRPENKYLATYIFPDTSKRVLFRRRNPSDTLLDMPCISLTQSHIYIV